MLRFLFRHPIQAAKAFAQGLLGRDDALDTTAADEEKRLGFLRMSIALYRESFGRLPAKLEDLCFDHHHDAKWDGAFIKWRGEKTFCDLFGQPYSYSPEATPVVISLGLEAWKRRRDQKAGTAPESMPGAGPS